MALAEIDVVATNPEAPSFDNTVVVIERTGRALDRALTYWQVRAAGYYSYVWADVLTADPTEAFEAAPGGYCDEALASKLVTHLFAARNAVDPADAYRAVRGRDAQLQALMRDRGFPVPVR